MIRLTFQRCVIPQQLFDKETPESTLKYIKSLLIEKTKNKGVTAAFKTDKAVIKAKGISDVADCLIVYRAGHYDDWRRIVLTAKREKKGIAVAVFIDGKSKFSKPHGRLSIFKNLNKIAEKELYFLSAREENFLYTIEETIREIFNT